MDAVFKAFVTMCAWVAGIGALAAICGIISEFRKVGHITSSCGEAYDWPSLIMLIVMVIVLLTFFFSEVTKP